MRISIHVLGMEIEMEIEIETMQTVDEETLQLIDKPNTKVAVWKYFGFSPDEKGQPGDIDHPTCKVCFVKVSAKNANLYSHLKNCHPDKYIEVKPPGLLSAVGASSSVSSGQLTIAASLEKTRMFSSKSREYKELTNAVTYCLAKDLLPIYSVEKEGFKTMLKSFNPKYQLPSRHYFTRVAIPTLYTTTKEMVEHTIKTDMVYFDSTTDLWSSAAMQPYISYSIHFIDKVWQLKTYCLHTHFIPEDHTGETSI